MILSQYMQGLLAAWLTGGVMPAPPASMVMHLSTVDPTDAGTGIVTNGGGHTNTVVWSAPLTNEANGAKTANTLPMSFVGLPAGTLTHAAVYDNAGNPLMYGAMDVPLTLTAGGGASFSISDLSFAMSGFTSQYVGEAVINWMRGTPMPAAPVTVQCALSTSNPLRDGTGITEPSATDGYARKTYTLGAPNVVVGVGTEVANVTDFVFPICTTNSWGAVSHVVVFDQTGNQLFTGTVASPQVVHVGETFGVAAGGMTVVIQ